MFGSAVVVRWDQGSALEGREAWFGILVGVEVLAAGLGCLALRWKDRGRWMAWWVAVVVAAHFIPLAVLLDDLSLLALAAIQIALLVALRGRLKASEVTTSRLAGPAMGASLLGFACVSVVVFAFSEGSPW